MNSYQPRNVYVHRYSKEEVAERSQALNKLAELAPFAYINYFKEEIFNLHKHKTSDFKEIYISLTYGTPETWTPEQKKLVNDFTYDFNQKYADWYQVYTAYTAEQERIKLQYEMSLNQITVPHQEQFGVGSVDYYQQQQQQQQQQYYPQNAYSQNAYNQNSQHFQQAQYQQQAYHQAGHQQHHQGHQQHNQQGWQQKDNHYHKKRQNIGYVEKEKEVIPEKVEKKVEIKIVPKKFSIQEIKDFINTKTLENVSEDTKSRTRQINSWEKKEVEVEIENKKGGGGKKTGKYENRGNNSNNNNSNNNSNRADFATGKNFKPRDIAQEAKEAGYKPTNEVIIKLGANEDIKTREIKRQIRAMAGKGFTEQKIKENELLSEVDKAKKEIVYNLNLLAPENIKDIQKDLIPFLYNHKDICDALIQQIILKAWDQPKYASTYAKLCNNFCKKSISNFKFSTGGEKSTNPFKLSLIDRVQHSFDEKTEKFPAFEGADDKELFLKEHKKKILSNVKFIAELIVEKVLKKRIIKYCISQLLHNFLSQYSQYNKGHQLEHSVYDYYFEAVIEFIENIGEKFDAMDEDKKEGLEMKIVSKIFDEFEEILSNQLDFTNAHQIDENLENFRGEEYFKLFALVDTVHLKPVNPRISALLQNLVERKNKNWKKHLSSADGPKKLKDFKDEGEEEKEVKKPQNKEKMEQERLDKRVKEMFERWEDNKGQELKDFKDILRFSTHYQFYMSFLKQLSDGKKDKVIKRVALVDFVLKEKFRFKDFQDAWFNSIKFMAFSASDFPFCGAAFANVLIKVLEAEQAKVKEFWEQFEDEDQEYFMEEIFQKFYHYSQNEETLKFVKEKKKLSGLI